jgi:hypothetical protein
MVAAATLNNDNNFPITNLPRLVQQLLTKNKINNNKV